MFRVVVKTPLAPARRDYETRASDDWSVRRLKDALSAGHPCRPAAGDMRLVMCGRVPYDGTLLGDVRGAAEVLVVHMVLRSGVYEDAAVGEADGAFVEYEQGVGAHGASSDSVETVEVRMAGEPVAKPASVITEDAPDKGEADAVNGNEAPDVAAESDVAAALGTPAAQSTIANRSYDSACTNLAQDSTVTNSTESGAACSAFIADGDALRKETVPTAHERPAGRCGTSPAVQQSPCPSAPSVDVPRVTLLSMGADALGGASLAELSNALIYDGTRFYVVRGGAAFWRAKSMDLRRPPPVQHAPRPAPAGQNNGPAPNRGVLGMAFLRLAFMFVILVHVTGGVPIDGRLSPRILYAAAFVGIAALVHADVVPARRWLRELRDAGAAVWDDLRQRGRMRAARGAGGVHTRAAAAALDALVHCGDVAASFVLSLLPAGA